MSARALSNQTTPRRSSCGLSHPGGGGGAVLASVAAVVFTGLVANLIVVQVRRYLMW